MNYDEIDDYVDSLFARGILDSSLVSDRSDRIDQVIQDAYDEVIAWHNAQISEGTDPRSGLHGLPYIPWDERIDGAAAMYGNGSYDGSFERNVREGVAKAVYRRADNQPEPLGCVLAVLSVGIVIMLLCFMSFYPELSSIFG